LNSICNTQANSNETSLLHRVGVECLIFGAGIREGNIHTPQEKVKIDDIYKAIDFYQHAIERFCL
jgi:succinyl-diaminopimelate desuccinylase